jgi:hypothetical protein
MERFLIIKLINVIQQIHQKMGLYLLVTLQLSALQTLHFIIRLLDHALNAKKISHFIMPVQINVWNARNKNRSLMKL